MDHLNVPFAVFCFSKICLEAIIKGTRKPEKMISRHRLRMQRKAKSELENLNQESEKIIAEARSDAQKISQRQKLLLKKLKQK